MDKRINTKKVMNKPVFGLATFSLLIGFSWYVMSSPNHKQTDVDMNILEIDTINNTILEERITTRGTFIPSKTIYLDAIEGGRVDKIFVEDGTYVKKGQKLLALSNTSLQLDVISREAQISEQLNNLQNTQLAIEQNSLKLEQDMANFNYKINQLERVSVQNKDLLLKNLISEDNHQRVQEELSYLKIARALTIKNQNLDNKIRVTQLSQLKDSVKQLQSNLKFARKNLDNLVVKSPMDGQLSSLKALLGQSKNRGERLGQIDNTKTFKVEAFIDEFYLNQLHVGQKAQAEYSEKEYDLIINKIFSQVENGKFKVEFKFDKQQPNSMRRGQNLTLSISLSDKKDTLAINDNGFFQDTGGHWVFVLSNDNKTAIKRKISLGRKNHNKLEILNGLSEGDLVITSSYIDFQQYDILNLK